MTEIEVRVMTVIRRAAMLSTRTFDADTTLAALDIGSLERIECMLALEDEFQLELPEPDFKRMLTVRDVVDHVRRALGENGGEDAAGTPTGPRQGPRRGRA
jgi:acyl carrier protein